MRRPPSSSGPRGYREVRRFYDMAVDLDAEPVEPELAAPFALDVFREEDAHAFHAAMVESFQDHWEWHGAPFDEWWELRRGQDRDAHGSLWFVVRDGGELAAVVRNEARPESGYVGLIGVRRPWRGRGLAKALLYRTFAEFWRRGTPRVTPRRRRRQPHGRDEAVRKRRHVRRAHERRLREGDCMSLLRAKCPTCRAFTAVAVGNDYECHSCGRTFAAGLVRVPRAWGDGGEEMIEAAGLPLNYPEASVVEEDSLVAQTLAVASDLPARPLVLGGCCCSHIGAVEGLAARHERLGVIWLDAHGDLNTPQTSPSGNEWGMPLRMLLDGGAVEARDVALVGTRNLDPPEVEFMAAAGIDADLDRVLGGATAVYVALDCDVLDPGEMTVFMPEPGGMTVAEVERLFGEIRGRATVAGAGLTGLAPDPANVEPLERLCAALGF